MNEEIKRHLEEIERMIRIDELMKEWAVYFHSQDQWKDAIFVEDGPFPYYWNQKIKFLFIGRELYGTRNEADPPTIKYWDEREGMQKLGVFQSRLLYLAYGIINGQYRWEAWRKMDLAEELNCKLAEDSEKIGDAFSYAFMNASKILNEKSSHVEKDIFGKFIKDKINRAFFIREIDLLAPDIIVTGNLNDTGFWGNNENNGFYAEFKEKIKPWPNPEFDNDNCFVWKYTLCQGQEKKDIPMLDGHHFSARGETFEKFYEPICKAAKMFTKPILLVSREDREIVIRYKGEKVFSISRGGSDDAKLITALRETLLHMPPEEGAQVIENGVAIDFSDPELEKLIRNETAMKTVRI